MKPEAFADERFGAITVKDILAELEKPARDPRPDFKVARYSEGVEDIKDLQPGMTLEGTVSNVAQFGAFVDLGVHQDGLIHVSQLADKFVSDAREVVKTGDVVKVKVLEVDLARKRIALTMKLDAKVVPAGQRTDNAFRPAARGERPGGSQRAAKGARSGRRLIGDGRGICKTAAQGLNDDDPGAGIENRFNRRHFSKSAPASTIGCPCGVRSAACSHACAQLISSPVDTSPLAASRHSSAPSQWW